MISSVDSKWTIEFAAVDARIQGATVLSNVDWCIHAGEHWGIVGPNGSGKSSLLNLISGQLWPAPGRGRRRYTFDDRVFTDATEAKRRITSVGPELQNRYARLNWNFTVLDVVLTGIFHTEIPRRTASVRERRRAAEILSEFGLSELADRLFLELSRGEQRRVLIARGIAFKPEILLLDEPASGLDHAARVRLEETIERASLITTVIASAHAFEQLSGITTHYLELDEGRVVGQGEIESSRRLQTETHAALVLEDARDRTAHSEQPTIVIRDTNIWLSGRHVLKNIDWTLSPRQHWLIVGNNGAGKSSFLRLLHGQLRPALGGSITWPALGNPRNIWRLRRKIGWVAPELQAGYRYPTTAFECIASGFKSSIGLTHRLADDEARRTQELLARFSLQAFRDRKLDTLSYGQLRRVLIARTLATAPSLLLLDEPWEGLDPETIGIVRRELQRAAGSGTQLVCISHSGDMGLGFTHELEFENGAIVRTGLRSATHASANASPLENSANAPTPERNCRAR